MEGYWGAFVDDSLRLYGQSERTEPQMHDKHEVTCEETKRGTQAVCDLPAVDEIGRQLSLVTSSLTFRAAPRLSAFLRFVVTAQLEGKGDRIKGYTIAVEALGRDASFDPQIDPIVRVEARRLRDALARYYSGPGRDDEVIIDLPRGGYIPAFRRRSLSTEISTGEPNREVQTKRLAAWTHRYAKPLRIVAITVGVLAVLEVLFDIDRPLTGEPVNSGIAFRMFASNAPVRAPTPRKAITPVIQIHPLTARGMSLLGSSSATMFRDQLIDALARFDDVKVVGASEGPTAPADYRLSLATYSNPDGPLNVTPLLEDLSDGSVVWSNAYDYDARDPKGQARTVRDIAIALLQPAGVIQARERLKRDAVSNMEDPYRCLLDANTYFASYAKPEYAVALACLERASITTPEWVMPYAQLAHLHLRDYQFGIVGPPGDRETLRRALDVVHRAIEIRPNSAFAQAILQDVLVARGDIAGAKIAGETAIALNPSHPSIVYSYATLLLALGEIDEGMAIVRKIIVGNPIVPRRYHFLAALAAYFKGDLSTAATEVDRDQNTYFPSGLVLRAIVDARNGNRLRARQAIELLREKHPDWRGDIRNNLARIFPRSALIDRMASDFAAVTAELAMQGRSEPIKSPTGPDAAPAPSTTQSSAS